MADGGHSETVERGRKSAGKLRVFISYSRDDLDFADQLDAALDLYGFDCTIDRQGISGGEDWRTRLGNLLRDAETVVFVLSPSSARSEICGWEVDEAARHGKRIIPVCCCDLGEHQPPQRLRDLNYIFFYAEQKAPGSGFGLGLQKLVTALNTDLDWMREHTRLLQRATEWEAGGKPANRLLSGVDIAAAKAWAARRPKDAPEPTALHLDFIRASEAEEASRSNAERQQLQAMAAAQEERGKALQQAEEALKKAAEAQRKRSRARNIAFVSVTALAALAIGLAGVAENRRQSAENIFNSATNLIAKITQKTARPDEDTAAEMVKIFQWGADELDDPIAIANLGWLFETGVGVKRDYKKAFEYYSKAADRENAYAVGALARLYELGNGVDRSYPKAIELYKKAVDMGYSYAMVGLAGLYENGLGTEPKYEEARALLMKAEELGESGATTQLGVMAYYGHGQTPDYTAARRYFEKAAEAGDSAAENNLGILYRHGQGVEQDYAKAHEYFFRAAIQEHGGAMANLASLYIEGHGVNVDLVEARRWLEQGVETDDPDAKRNLEQLPMDELFAEGKYGEALDAQKALLESARKAEVEAEGKEGQRTSTEMARVAQFTVFTKDYPGAIAAAEAALKQFPDELMARAQEAHALLLSERLDEARGIYLENRGKTVASRGHLGWERVIAEDFHKLRRAGLGHPKMIEIEDALGLPTR